MENAREIKVISKRTGKCYRKLPLSIENLGECLGEMCRVFCHKDSKIYEGFCDPYRIKTNDFNGKIEKYIVLWLVENLEENKYVEYQCDIEGKIKVVYKINIEDIESIYMIRYSHPRCAGFVSNSFKKILSKNKKRVNNAKKSN